MTPQRGAGASAFVLLFTLCYLSTPAQAQGLLDRIIQGSRDIAEDIGDRGRDLTEEVGSRGREAVESIGGVLGGDQQEPQDQADGQPTVQPTSTSSASAAAGTATTDTLLELNYNNLLRQYIATHHDLLDSDKFAWHYFEVFLAPDTPEACAQLKQETTNTIRFASHVAQQKEAFATALEEFAGFPTTATYKTQVTLELSVYDLQREAFPVNRIFAGGLFSDLEVRYRCDILHDVEGPTHAPEFFQYDNLLETGITEIPLPVDVAADLLDDANLDFNSGREEFYAEAEYRVGPLPFIDGRMVEVPVELAGFTVRNPVSGAELYRYSAEPSSSSADTAILADSISPHPLTASAMVLLMLRDNPDLLTDEKVQSLALEQIRAEQEYWTVTDFNVMGRYNAMEVGAGSVNVNPNRVLFSYEWQVLRETDPAAAASVLDTFIRADSDWNIYRLDPDYDARLDAYAETAVFSREALGLPAVNELRDLPYEPRSQMRRMQLEHLPSADFIAPELAGVMQEFLQQAGAQLPERFVLDFELQARFDTATDLLLLAHNYAGFSPDEPVRPLMQPPRPQFADDDTQLQSAVSLPLPRTAEGRVLYRVAALSEPELVRPGLNRSSMSPDRFRRLLWENATGGVLLGSIDTLALDRELAFPAVPVDRATAERAQGNVRGATGFPVTGRVLLDIERSDVVRLDVPYRGQERRIMHNGTLLASIAGMELIDSNGELITTIERGALAAAGN
ncbi:MAG: hypothetical protein WDZ76_13365 [Pseudohongiellaceae bacterium]